MDNTSNNRIIKPIVSAYVDPSMKKAFKRWWESHGFASEAEAIRYFVRQCIGSDFKNSSQQPASVAG